jgi:hypothetical protein
MAEDLVTLDGVGDAADFCEEHSAEIEVEIERMGIALGIDWNDEFQVRQLAKEALEHAQEAMSLYTHDLNDYHQKAKVTLFGLAAMMMDIMAKSAGKGIHTHGGTAWKAFSRALMRESGMPIPAQDNHSNKGSSDAL